jgi:hypothetical protein
VDNETKKEIKEIIGDAQCSHNCQCFESCFEHIFKATSDGVKIVIKCSNRNPSDCPYAEKAGDDLLCNCSVRYYVAKKLNR